MICTLLLGVFYMAYWFRISQVIAKKGFY